MHGLYTEPRTWHWAANTSASHVDTYPSNPEINIAEDERISAPSHVLQEIRVGAKQILAQHEVWLNQERHREWLWKSMLLRHMDMNIGLPTELPHMLCAP